ncbi:helix-turn-helix transcriptional regulator [Hymenobacter sp.]|jgi:AraC-like DNA-binding protein|uniref:helix-turn-helix transcriptional regulator n=1 Tax=Hymenobacter sp. TaxID=1898978 RepID=UPI002EDA7447
MKPTSLEALYAKFKPVAGETPPDMQRELGQFDVFSLGALRPGQSHRPPTPFNRQAFYKISLTHGRGRFELADQTLEVGPHTLFLATPRTAYRWESVGAAPTGYFCIFTDAFLLPTKGGTLVEALPIFQPGARPAVPLTEAEWTAVETIFQKMVQEMAADYAYKYDLLRTYLVELIHVAQKLQPPPVPALPPAASRVATQFTELLEQQFPLAGPAPHPRLRTAKDYADHLAVHIVHLNRVLKQATGHTTTTLISNRMAQEAKLLLKQPTRNVSEIADQLGFADVAHFCTFFKRHTGLTPGDFRR